MTTSRLMTATSAAGSRRRMRRDAPAPPAPTAVPCAVVFTGSALPWRSFDQLPREGDEGVLEIGRSPDPGWQLAIERLGAQDGNGGSRTAVLPAALAGQPID